jgi:EAL domain-containing protein (putative c-di-GMP-specific phosphodiesterase class I)
VWVNLSSRQLAQPDLPELVADCLERADLSPHRLKLELTETVLQQATSTGLSNVAQLAAAGVGIALDDFGTGYSSLGHLGDVPLAGVKIDRSFVAGLGRNEHGAAIVAAIISLTRALGLDAVAEGVESERQADLLRELGCPLAQGYLFGAPGPGIG